MCYAISVSFLANGNISTHIIIIHILFSGTPPQIFRSVIRAHPIDMVYHVFSYRLFKKSKGDKPMYEKSFVNTILCKMYL